MRLNYLILIALIHACYANDICTSNTTITFDCEKGKTLQIDEGTFGYHNCEDPYEKLIDTYAENCVFNMTKIIEKNCTHRNYCQINTAAMPELENKCPDTNNTVLIRYNCLESQEATTIQKEDIATTTPKLTTSSSTTSKLETSSSTTGNLTTTGSITRKSNISTSTTSTPTTTKLTTTTSKPKSKYGCGLNTCRVYCAPGCQRTCFDSYISRCSEPCIKFGCRCREGYYRDPLNLENCIKYEHCPQMGNKTHEIYSPNAAGCQRACGSSEKYVDTCLQICEQYGTCEAGYVCKPGYQRESCFINIFRKQFNCVKTCHSYYWCI